MKLKEWQKVILSILTIVVGGFILFNIAFIIAAGIHQIGNLLVRLFSGRDDFAVNPMFWRFLFVVVILFISWFIFKSKWNTLVKATYLTMPLMVLLIVEGILLYRQPSWVPIGIGAIIIASVLFYLYQKKLPWQYYFATFFTGAVALVVVLAGIEI